MISYILRLLWPSSLKGQVLQTIGLALLLAQTLNVLLVYRAQSDRREMALINAAAFRLLMGASHDHLALASYARQRRFGSGSVFRLEVSPRPPQRPGEEPVRQAEGLLRQVLADQGVAVAEIQVFLRDVRHERPVLERLALHPRLFSQIDDGAELLVAAIRRRNEQNWQVARVLPYYDSRSELLLLLGQTLLIYLVLVGAVALILRRITGPLAALTGRLERFAERADSQGQLPPEGPMDVRRLIVAHNAMEDRIAGLLAEKDVMLGAIGHDLKTPLAALRVRIESVEDEGERAKMAATIEDIVRSLDDLLALARVGRSSEPYEATELSALVSSIVEEYEDMDKSVVLGDTQRIVLALRQTWLRRAVRNLIDNALRYGMQARVSLERQDRTAVIRIDDDGPGIPAEHMTTMFEPFKRGEPSRNSRTGGAGLGLTLARAIAEQHGGSLTIANRPGPGGTVQGLTATLRLPLV